MNSENIDIVEILAKGFDAIKDAAIKDEEITEKRLVFKIVLDTNSIYALDLHYNMMEYKIEYGHLYKRHHKTTFFGRDKITYSDLGRIIDMEIIVCEEQK